MFPLISTFAVMVSPPTFSPEQIQRFLDKANRDQAERIKIVQDLNRRAAVMEERTQILLQRVAETNKRAAAYFAKKRIEEAEQKKQAQVEKKEPQPKP